MLKIARFHASWCEPCKQLAPIMKEVKEENPDIEFVDYDVDVDGDKAGEFGVMGVPTVVIISDDLPIDRFSGVQSKGFINDLIRSYK